MNATQLITIATAVLLLIGGVAAVGAASPVDQANANVTDASEENATDVNEVGDAAGERVDATDERADRAGTADGVGPSDGLPSQVPDHVSQLHETIESFLNGSIDTLGESLNELLSGGEQADGAAGDTSEQPENVGDDVESNA